MARQHDFFLATVHEAIRITPHMMRIRFGGDELQHFTTSGKPDERLGVYFPRQGQRAPQRPTISDGIWTFEDSDNEPEVRSYTVRKVLHDQHELVLDFVIHDGGIASTWAASAQPGDIVGLSSADGWFSPPANTEHYVLIADATGLPAVGRILEELPADSTATVIVEIIDPRDALEVQSEATVDYRWLPYSGMGTSPSALPDAVESLPPLTETSYVWVAAEAAATRTIRKHLRASRGVPSAQMTVLGYWRANKEDFVRRYEPVKEALLAKYSALVDSGFQGQELIDAWDNELERAGF
ncbi:siderophore-interacting protein [Hoyosella rhizosphaerae]|uniref:Siderophore-interacting protein n=1 Tax=Hoyosella rhizosphaerae TaxID=1755582 RepID=A0A916U9M4_9ACTN|nr:siderophore-interacting protein [Hoyosella rhizosphaerae]MBN4926090.1 siderophore-interacting protein [Hoyosella rhizosphaerae]GGC65664.1 siderophore-interacting protein [Hoyosella rhizosphaerae]